MAQVYLHGNEVGHLRFVYYEYISQGKKIYSYITNIFLRSVYNLRQYFLNLLRARRARQKGQISYRNNYHFIRIKMHLRVPAIYAINYRRRGSVILSRQQLVLNILISLSSYVSQVNSIVLLFYIHIIIMARNQGLIQFLPPDPYFHLPP